MFSSIIRRSSILLILTLFLSLSMTVVFAIDVSVRVGDRLVQASVYEANGSDLLIWIPSEYGTQDTYRLIASKIQKYGVEIWYVDMFAANYLIHSANTINQIPDFQIASLISQVHQYSSNKTIWLMSSEKGAQLVLRGLHHWQKKNPQKNHRVGGVLLINPDLTYGSPPVGVDPDYLPIASVTNKSVAIIQSRFSKNYYYLPELVSQLKKGGAPVKTYIIDHVRERFYFRKLTEEAEDRARNRELPSLLVRAISDNRKFIKNVKAHDNVPKHLSLPKVDLPLNMTPILKPKPLPSIVLNDAQNQSWNSATMRGKVLLISIWPYWCAACRYQLKQQQVFYEKARSHRFEFLSIYIDATPLKIKKLQKRHQLIFPLLQGNISLIRRMNVHDFPSTLLVDKKGNIRYAMYGVVKRWDNDNFIKLIHALKQE